jgi:hypothetical protein
MGKKRKKIRASRAIWRYSFFNEDSNGPNRVLYDPHDAAAFMERRLSASRRNRHNFSHVEIMHMPSGLKTEVDRLADLEFINSTLVNHIGYLS